MLCNLLHLLLSQLVFPRIEERSISLHKIGSTPPSLCGEVTQVREGSACMHLVGVNVVALSTLTPLRGYQSCYACALDVLPDSIKAMVYDGQG